MMPHNSTSPAPKIKADQPANSHSPVGSEPSASLAPIATGAETPIGRSLATLLSRSLRLRCPVCGQGKLFRGWFRMHPQCQQCGYRFQREAGYWLGAIYVNYGLTALTVTAAYFALFFTDALPPQQVLWLLTAFCVLFPLWFFRYARSIWIGFDLYFDPEPAKKAASPNSADKQS